MSTRHNAQKREEITMNIVRERIVAARAKKGITQKQMAEILGISQPGYSQIESGKYPDMRISTLVKICEILDVSTDWLLGIITCDPDDKFTRFYMEVIDLILEYEELEMIGERASEQLTQEIDKMKRRYEDID